MHIQRLQIVQNITEYVQDAHWSCTLRGCTLHTWSGGTSSPVSVWDNTIQSAAPPNWTLNILQHFSFPWWKQGHIEYTPPAIFYLPQIKYQTNCIWVWNDSIRFNLQPKVSSFDPRSFPDLLLGQCNVRQDPIWRKSRRCIRHQLQRNTKLSPVLDKANWCKNNCSPDAKLRRHILAADALPANEGVNRIFYGCIFTDKQTRPHLHHVWAASSTATAQNLQTKIYVSLIQLMYWTLIYTEHTYSFRSHPYPWNHWPPSEIRFWFWFWYPM